MRRLPTLLLTVALLAVAAPAAARADDDGPAGALDAATARPYAPGSPFNQPAAGAAVLPRSARMVARMVRWHGPGDVVLGQAGTRDDYGHPVYAATEADPLVRLHATARYGRNPVEGMKIHVPSWARAAAGGDAHMAVVQPDGWEYDFWQVHGRAAHGGKLTFAWGGRLRIDGDGLGGGAVAAGYGALAGVVRPAELAAGRIDHALFVVVRCTTGFVWPAAQGGGACPRGERDGPPMGARLRLDLSPERIAALPVSGAARTILTALATYGAYVGDTGNASFAVQVESAQPWLSRGLADPLVAFARSAGLRSGGGHQYAVKLAPGIDWVHALRVVAAPHR